MLVLGYKGLACGNAILCESYARQSSGLALLAYGSVVTGGRIACVFDCSINQRRQRVASSTILISSAVNSYSS
jgi:hypothetical protein